MRSSASAYRSSASLISRQPSGSSQPAGPVAGDESGRARMLSDRAGMILGMTAQPVTDVILEIGKKRVFACAAAWPGWCRSGRSEELALETLAAYLPRYAPVARLAGLALPPGAADAFAVTERLPGTAIISIGHRSTLGAFHRRRFAFVGEQNHYDVRDVPVVSAAE